MAISITSGTQGFGTQLQELLMADDIVPGAQASYETCKQIFLYHPLGQKIVDFPIQMAMFKPREITVPKAPDDGEMLVEAFQQEWKSLKANEIIANAARLAQIYGISTTGLMVKDDDTEKELDFKGLARAAISLNTWDPLNTAGSLVLNQDPNDMDFQKVKGVAVSGKNYHRSRVCVLMNEAPIYIAYESAGFGFVGRSVYQRGLFALKSFLQTMATDDMIAMKAGVLIAKMESQSSAVDAPMMKMFGFKRSMLKEARTGNVLSIGVGEDIESLNLQNLDGAASMARKNIIENIASACGRPAKLLLSETFAEGFGEGTEDAKAIAQFIDGIREWLQPIYDFMDEIAMYRAWNEDFYETVQSRYPEQYGSVSYNVAFNEWRNSFIAQWPNLLDEPESEKAKADRVVLDAMIAIFEVLAPELPPSEKARLIEWVMDCLNSKKRLFPSPLELDIDAIAEYEPPTPDASMREPELPRPESFRDSQSAVKRGREVLDGVDDDVRREAFRVLRTLTQVA